VDIKLGPKEHYHLQGGLFCLDSNLPKHLKLVCPS